MNITRRDFLKALGLGTLSLLVKPPETNVEPIFQKSGGVNPPETFTIKQDVYGIIDGSVVNLSGWNLADD